MKLIFQQGGWLILLSFIASLMLTIIPLPDMLRYIRPEWSALVLLYWCMALPQRIGVGVGWIVGLFLDVLKGALLGQHALGLAVVAYLTLQLHQRIRVYPLWQQSLTVLMLLNLYQLLLIWFDGITGQASKGLSYWLPPLTGMFIWPWVFLLMRYLRRRYKVK